MINKITQAVHIRHKINYRFGYALRNVENGETMVYYTNTNSPWMERLSKTKEWLEEQEELRLQGAQIDRPNTKWVFQRHTWVDLKVILDRQPLQIGFGPLPDWIRNKHEVLSLDNYNDNLCIFRCVAVHQGSDRRFNTCRARELAQSFFAAYRKLTSVTSQQFGLLEKHFKQGIAAYSVTNEGHFILIHQPSHYDKVSHPTMHIGIYEGHAFLIKDINKVSNNFTCGECMARFTRADNLKRHAPRCTSGRTNIECPGYRILAPESAFEKAFYPEGCFGIKATCWLKYVSRQSGKHIHHHRCGHGGERFIKGAPVDGYHPETKTVFQFHGCHWHGCIQCFPNLEQRNEVIRVDKNGIQTTRKIAYIKTLARSKEIRNLGYNLVERWEQEKPSPWWEDKLPPKRNETYPHAIVFDFESYQDKTKASNPTRDLSYESEHVPISVSIADTLTQEPEYICSKDPEELITLFYQSLVQRQIILKDDVEEIYIPKDIEYLANKQQKLIKQWCGQVPVIGFNSGRYDLNLIRKYLISHLGQEKVDSGEKQGQIMYMKSPQFVFLDVINYLSPGITYDKWVKTYGAKQTKSWLPYEWFDSADKLDYKGLPLYWCWYSQLKNSFALTPKEYDECKRVFQERGMQTFGVWLEYYNNLDVTPFLETLEKVKAYYTKRGVDIFKDAVSLPGVSMQYILRRTLRKRNAPELYASGPEAYEMLKAAVVGGPSLVFTRKHVAGQTRIRSHKYDLARIVKRILGFDANSLYRNTMAKEMPCGKETVVHYEDPVQAAQDLIPRMYKRRWFGFAEVDIEVPRDLWEEFEEFPPIFINQSVGAEGIPQHMKDYLAKSDRAAMPDQKKVLGVLKAKKVLLYAPLLAWYHEHGLEITAVHRKIDYVPQKIFDWFVQEVANMRRKGDAEAEKALLAEVFKLLGNSAYGKFIEAVERQTKVMYTKDEDEVDKHLRSAYFEDLEEIGDAYKIESRKKEVKINRPFQVGIVVYQPAYVDRRDYELIQMDTDSMYFALSYDTLGEAVKPELLKEFENNKKQWLSWDKWSNREPGLFKLEKEGTRAIALCSKCYFIEDEKSSKAKKSCKGVSQKQNELLWSRYEMALDGYNDMATKRGFRMKDGAMYTYEQHKLGLSSYYD